MNNKISKLDYLVDSFLKEHKLVYRKIKNQILGLNRKVPLENKIFDNNF